MRFMALLAMLVATALSRGPAAHVEWAQFRGPNGSGVAEQDKPPVTFGPSEKRLWRATVPPGHSSPIVWDDHLFITGVEGRSLVTMALRRKDGTVLWRQPAPSTPIEPVHEFNDAAASTPVTDGTRVYVYFGSYGLIAYDFNGKEAWRLALPLPASRYGTATSPILLDGNVILQRDGNGGDSELIAVNARTGAVAWRTRRPLSRDSWSTPMIWRQPSPPEIITIGTNRVVAYAPDGTERWSAGGLGTQPIHVAVAGPGLLFASMASNNSPADPMELPTWASLIASYDRDKDGQLAVGEFTKDAGVRLRAEVAKETPGNFVSMPDVLGFADTNKDRILTKGEWDELVAGIRAREDMVLAIRPGGAGDITKTHVVWKGNRGISEIPSPLYYRDRVYFVRSGGMVTSYAADTGTLILDRQRLGALGQYVASPVAADGRIYAANELGTVIVFRAADTLDVLARNDLLEAVTATPAIADNTLYIRTATHLWAFGQ